MGVISWLVLGGLAGWVASIIAGRNARMGLLANILVGILGAAVGGWIFGALGGPGVTGFNVYSLLVATVGASALLFLLRLIGR